MTGDRNKRTRLRILVSPKTIVFSALAGIVLGYLKPAYGSKLEDLGTLYLALLQMCVLPILITAIVSSLGRLFSSGTAMPRVRRLVVVFAAGLFFATLLGMITASIGRPGASLKDSSQSVVGSMLAEREVVNPAMAISEAP